MMNFNEIFRKDVTDFENDHGRYDGFPEKHIFG